ncbi:MAG: hypothetical protein ACI9LM_004271 [Alteromonadaceae bacterium]|jgi:hypothetical protein
MSDDSSGKEATTLIQANINQSIAEAVQDATDLLKNISTIETTVIGVASAKWLAEPANVAYKEIIDNAKENITFAVKNLVEVGSAGASVLGDLKPK